MRQRAGERMFPFKHKLVSMDAIMIDSYATLPTWQDSAMPKERLGRTCTKDAHTFTGFVIECHPNLRKFATH